MHTGLIYFAFAWLAILFLITIFILARPVPLATRILALDILGLILIGLLALYARFVQEDYFLDIALVLALLSFIGTLSLARYYGEREVSQ